MAFRAHKEGEKKELFEVPTRRNSWMWVILSQECPFHRLCPPHLALLHGHEAFPPSASLGLSGLFIATQDVTFLFLLWLGWEQTLICPVSCSLPSAPPHDAAPWIYSLWHVPGGEHSACCVCAL